MLAAPPHLIASIVIPTHNSTHYIEKTILSIIRSITNLTLEIILIDDASTDIEKLKLIAKKYKAVTLIEKKAKSNAADSRNIGLIASSGGYVFFLDSDDSYTEKHIQQRVNLHNSTNAGFIFGRYIERNEGVDTEKMTPEYISNDIRDYIFSSEGDVRSSTISICKQNYKNTTFDAAQYKHQDWGYAIRAYDQGEKILFDESFSVIIDNTQNTSRMSSKMNVSASEYFLKRYISNPEHILSFARAHLKLSIMSKDKKGLELLRNVLIPTLKKLPTHTKIKVVILCTATFPTFRDLARLLFILKTKLRTHP
ncbi:glycosyltransferase family 2 protein [Pseudomonas fragi]|uniref:glycosyltransferase family 2 protein n=1 Tax=Pseudomonas fragi TaxID=296 RepID=UPI0028EF5C80|nr:glycosyltransferase family 2 protein [Pseudomonas fragi]